MKFVSDVSQELAMDGYLELTNNGYYIRLTESGYNMAKKNLFTHFVQYINNNRWFEIIILAIIEITEIIR
jgi:hypothetical protein